MSNYLKLLSDIRQSATGVVFGWQGRFSIEGQLPYWSSGHALAEQAITDLVTLLQAKDSDSLSAVWRYWPNAKGQNIDQLQQLINDIKCNPTSRRLIASGWDAAHIEQLTPFNVLFQCFVLEGTLSAQVYQSRCDVAHELPRVICFYSLLTQLIALHCGLVPKELVWTVGEAYLDKPINEAEWLGRTTLFRTVEIQPRPLLADYKAQDFLLGSPC